ncbi:hypothetical protein V6N12_048566 [Hibiscus sabdariffa]|uniref:Uncharacterized protein n=1 Tax=Hibiscus sabdariffa TaxID=183260 RepID=A0ABR2ELD1_9ROSI
MAILRNDGWLDVEKDITLRRMFKVCLRGRSHNSYKLYQLAEGYMPPPEVVKSKMAWPYGRGDNVAQVLVEGMEDKENWMVIYGCFSHMSWSSTVVSDEDDDGEGEAAEVIPLNIMLLGEIIPNAFLEELLAWKRSVVEARAWLVSELQLRKGIRLQSTLRDMNKNAGFAFFKVTTTYTHRKRVEVQATEAQKKYVTEAHRQKEMAIKVAVKVEGKNKKMVDLRREKYELKETSEQRIQHLEIELEKERSTRLDVEKIL